MLFKLIVAMYNQAKFNKILVDTRSTTVYLDKFQVSVYVA